MAASGYTTQQASLYPFLNPDETPLPTGFNHKDRSTMVELSHGSLRVHYTGLGKTDSDAAAVRANTHIPPACGIFYFEVTIVNRGKDCYIGIGLCTSTVSLNRLPGWEDQSYGYHGDDGNVFVSSNAGTAYGPTYTTGDVIGCCVNFIDNNCFYTKNGTYLGVAFRNLQSQLFPCVGLRTLNEAVEANFGQKPFLYNIQELMQETRIKVQARIESQNLSSTYLRTNSLQGIMTTLINSYLIHHGFSETAQVFARDTNTQIAESVESVKIRQKIRQLVLSGDIIAAVNSTNDSYPGLLESRPQLFFSLQCRRFIECVASGIQDAAAIIHQGQELQTLCDSYTNKPWHEVCKKDLEEAFSLLAYLNPSNSPMAYLLEPKQREPIANSLNSAILASQGMPQAPALEKLIQHTQVSIHEMLRLGLSEAAFASVNDFFVQNH